MTLPPAPPPAPAPDAHWDAHFRAIVDSSDDAIISKDLAGIITSWNPGATAIFGYQAQDMIGQPMLRLFPPDRVREETEILRKIAAGEKVDHFETVRRHRDGHLINISATISPIRDAQGRIIGASKVARDISDRQRYEAIFALSPDAFITLDRQERVSHASPAIEGMTGLPASAWLGLGLDAVVERLNQGSDAASQIEGSATLWQLARGEHSLPLQRRTLGQPEARVLSLRARSSDEGLVSLVLSLRDISHETRVERLKSEFMATAAHELRTPMTSIRGFIELLTLRDEALSSAERRHLLDIILKQTLLINDTIDDLLDLDKLESRTTADLHLQPLDLVTLVQRELAGWSQSPGACAPTLAAEHGPCWVQGDETYLRRALMNLLSNARKYSGDAAPVAVRVAPHPNDPGLLLLSVRDQGRGMSPEQLARYGERFYRADESGSVPGTGLGVSIVKQIVALHGGRLEVQSELGRGTVVTLCLPRLRTAAPEGPGAAGRTPSEPGPTAP
ncbi:PAS domain S-box protein [Curvibacter sp. HBC61]|uniref:histidine kinase n=1 Tax=Curvibacter cyanobacteriorum TaxID=3026422 RepID=A0ABT5N5Y5_9BURK|nr:PAS domain-containing sensor histidine kinase [Curvibacter sp. HBC61]MDD0840891.1 PAS domain S-box protein [Curvibacter sp. HBC61]